MEQNFFGHETCFELEDVTNQKVKSISTPISVSDDDSGCFECNICLDSALDPVVTFCGHLYCWPCIYKWLHVKTSSPAGDEQQPNCPVCKASISPKLLVPLYGRGKSSSESESKKAPVNEVIPSRPRPSGLNTVITNTSHQSHQLHPNNFRSRSQSESFLHQQYFPDPYGGHAPSPNLTGTTIISLFNPMIKLFGELMFARGFGPSHTSLLARSYLNNPMLRRQEIQLDKSLNRVSIFFLCCIFLCLLLF